MTVFTRLREQLAQALLTAPALADGRIYIERDRPIAQDEPDAIVIRLLSADASQKVHDHTDWWPSPSSATPAPPAPPLPPNVPKPSLPRHGNAFLRWPTRTWSVRASSGSTPLKTPPSPSLPCASWPSSVPRKAASKAPHEPQNTASRNASAACPDLSPAARA